jgi:hypothetical protein
MGKLFDKFKTSNMKVLYEISKGRVFAMALVFILCSLFASSQTDSLRINQPDTTLKPADTILKQSGTTSDKQTDKTSSKKGKGWNDEFIVYVGGSLNMLSVSSDRYENHIVPGYMLGAAYKRGKFFYWQVGARFNNAVYSLSDLSKPTDTIATDSVFSIRDIGIPITGGINFLSATNRIFALRLFISAIPSFAIGVGGNDLGINKDQINTFNLYGQAGIGVNIFFMVLEAGLNYGFMDVFKNNQSKPVQIFVHLGFRF